MVCIKFIGYNQSHYTPGPGKTNHGQNSTGKKGGPMHTRPTQTLRNPLEYEGINTLSLNSLEQQDLVGRES